MKEKPKNRYTLQLEAECMELLAMAIDDLQAAYRIMAKEKEV